MLDAERPAPVPEVIRQTALPDIWALTSADSRVIALYRTGRLEAMMHDFLHQITSAGILFIAIPPDEPADAEAIAAGPWLPGWQVSFVVLDAPDAAPPDRRGTVYLSVGLAGLVVMTLIGVAAGQTFRRHLRVARLKTDLVAAASHELRTPLASMRVLVDGLLADTELDAGEDPRVPGVDGGGERAAQPSHRELPHLLASRSRPVSVRVRARRSLGDRDVGRRRDPRSAADDRPRSRWTSSRHCRRSWSMRRRSARRWSISWTTR